VIVSHPSPLLSHAVVNFSYLGIPCFLARDHATVESVLGQISDYQQLEVCTQTAKLYLWHQTIANPAVCVKEGFGKHPAKISPSPLSTSLRLEIARETPEQIQILLIRLRTATSRHAGLQALKALREHPLIADINTLTQRQVQLLGKHPNVSTKTREIIAALTSYESAVARAFQEATAVFSRRSEENRLERLLHVEVLESLLLEPFDEPGAIGRCSLMQMERMSQATTALIAYQQKLGGTPGQFADLLMDVTRVPTTDPGLFQQWQGFLLELETAAQRRDLSTEEVEQFKAMMRSLRKSGMLPQWFLFYFKLRRSSAALSLGDMLAQFTADVPFLDHMAERRARIKRLSQQIDWFAHPETFQQAWAELEAEVKWWASPEMMQRIRSASSLAKNIAYQTMERLVTTLDTAVKTMKIGAGFKGHEGDQTRLFKQMLLSYHQLMAAWALTMSAGVFTPACFWTIPDIVEHIRKTLEGLPDSDPAQMMASREFSVTAATLGSQAAFNRHLPQTLEDILTLEHQNLLVILSALNLRALSNDAIESSYLPQAFKQVLEAVERRKEKHQIQRLGLTITENEIIYRGNYPLRMHSGQVELVYKKDTQRIVMQCHFMGDDRARWETIGDWVRLLNSAQVMSTASPMDVTEQEVAFAWDVDPSNINEAMMQFFAMGEYSNMPTADRMPTEVVQACRSKGSACIKKLFEYCNRHPTSPFALYFLTQALQGRYREWLGESRDWIDQLKFDSVKKAVGESVKNGKLFEGLAILAVLQDHGQITQDEITELLQQVR
jgi:hypothetical protein